MSTAVQPDPRRRVEPTDRGEAARLWVPRLHRPGWRFARGWALRLVLVLGVLGGVGIAIPLVAEIDRDAFEVINGVGYGPDWVFELLDPHERLYRGLLLAAIVVAFALRGAWVALGTAVAVMAAAAISYLLLEAVALLSDRPRPQEALDEILKPPGVDWAQASYPSGHMTVTTAMAAASAVVVPVLRLPMLVVVTVIGWSRLAFGAHFPLDVAAGAVLGCATALFSAALARRVGLLPPDDASLQGRR